MPVPALPSFPAASAAATGAPAADVLPLSPRSPIARSPRMSAPYPGLHHPTPEAVLQALEDAEDDAPLSELGSDAGDMDSPTHEALILRYALEWAVVHADVEMMGFLTALEGRQAAILDVQVDLLEDEDGWGAVGMAIQSSCGQSDKEEAVRLIVARWGVSAGPRGGRDHAGWTPLHLAALLSSPQIVSVLLNRGASPSALTDSGLSAYDLITGMEGREPLALLLDPLHADEAPGSKMNGPTLHQPPLSPHREELIRRRRYRVATLTRRQERRAAQARVKAERERWVRERAKNIGVNPGILFPVAAQAAQRDGADDEGEETDQEDEEDDDDEEELFLPTNALVFSLNQLGFIFDIFITKYPPLCQPHERRALPANAIYLFARFAHYHCDATWLEELVDGAIERIERGVYSNGEDLAFLAFWEYNLTLLLGLLRSDEPLLQACVDLNLLGMVEELINAIHVFVIRIAERKIDEVLDAAILDFESIEDLNEVRFTDQWNLFRSLTTRKKPREIKLATSVFSSTPNSPDTRTDSPVSPRRGAGAPPSPSPSGRSISDLKAEAREVLASGLERAQAVFGDKPSPTRVVDVLTNVLLILQLYDVNPAFIVQVFSQTFYWISSELFNRIITRRKYLCRTKAVQIRMNITAIEDWTRQNGLPPNVAAKHLEPVMQLLQWLQCLSGINQFDMLIGTVQNLRALNPLQMRRAVRDYRFEVNESRMADDCVQYLAQMQKDWEQRRVHIAGMNVQASQRGIVNGAEDDSMPIEALFDEGVGIGEWVPQTAPECLGELVDSRFMLPFLIPSTIELLLATPPSDAAYQNMLTELPLLPDGTVASRPLSRASYSSSRPMGWASQHEQRIRRLPEGFFQWLKDRQAEFVRAWGTKRDVGGSQKAVDVAPTRAAPVSAGALSRLPEDETTPSKTLPRTPQPQAPAQAHAPSSHSTPSNTHARKASIDLALRRGDKDRTPPGMEPIEMVFRPSPTPATYINIADPTRARPNGSAASAAAAAAAAPQGQALSQSPSDASPHYELARLRRERKTSISSVNSIGSAGGSDKKARWWKLSRKGSDTPSPDELASERERRRGEREDTAETIVPSPARRETPTKRRSSAGAAAPLVASPVSAAPQSIFETDEEMGTRR